MADPLERPLFNVPPAKNMDAYGVPISQDEGGVTSLLPELVLTEDDVSNAAKWWWNKQKQTYELAADYASRVKTPGKSVDELINDYVNAIDEPLPDYTLLSSVDDEGKEKDQPKARQTGLPAKPVSSRPDLPKKPDLSKYHQEQSFEEFAKQFGLDAAAKGYNTWDYIRDISAGLLASDDNTFLGAMGDAALLSNKNRHTMDAAQKDLQSRLAIAKYGADQKWKQKAFDAAVDMYGEDMSLYGDLLDAKGAGWKTSSGGSITETLPDGTKVKWDPVSEGAGNVQLLPQEMWQQIGDVTYVRSLDADQAARLDRNQEILQKSFNDMGKALSQKDNVKTDIDSWLRQTTAGGEFVISLKEVEGYTDIINDLREAGEKGAKQLVDLLSEGQPDAAEVARALTQLPQVFQQFKALAMSGPAANLESSAYAAIAQRANELAKQKLTSQLAATSKDNRFIYDLEGIKNDSLKQATQEINWDADNFQFQYRGRGATTKQLEDIRSASEDMRGIGWFNLAEAPEGYEKGYTPFHRPDERAMLNLDQLELAAPEAVNEAYTDMGRILNIMEREGYDPKQAKADINISYDDSNLIYGGEDLPFNERKDSKYQQPNTWYMEPKYYIVDGQRQPTSSLRKDYKIFWNGFKGKHFMYQNGQRIDVDINDQNNAEIPEPQAIRIN